MIRRILLAPPLALLPAVALAHTGVGAHGAPLAAGLTHPLLGADHLLAMVAVGVFAAMSGGLARLAFPAAFVGGLLAGGALGLQGAVVPAVEPAIVASVIALGAAILAAARPPLVPALAALALFGLAHGQAHGLEAPALGGPLYALGFLVATAALHGLGLAVGALARPGVVRALGAVTCLAGLALA
jgi:urease accessory protein